MASLSLLEKRQLEDLFGMSGGYVMAFTDATFEEFFRSIANINIRGAKYTANGRAKARCLRTFWELEPDALVAKVLAEMLSVWECENPEKLKDKAYIAARKTVARLQGGEIHQPVGETEQEFLAHDFGTLSFEKLPVEAAISATLERRYQEIGKGLKSQASLSVVILCGSILEGALYGIAKGNQEKFNRANSAPKDTDSGKVTRLDKWSLSDLINVAHELKLLDLDVKRFSEHLRDFRNYVHPYLQLKANFNPSMHTARICEQVLKAAVLQLSGD